MRRQQQSLKHICPHPQHNTPTPLSHPTNQPTNQTQQDPDTGVASEGSAALTRFAAAAPAHFGHLVDPSSPVGARLGQLVAGTTATLRHRVYALLVEAAGGDGEAAEALKRSGGSAGS